MARERPVVAIDGPAGSGKSTVARRVAAALDFTLVDTGAIYRCLALYAGESGVAPDDETALARLAAAMRIGFERGGLGERVWLDGREVTAAIRTAAVAQLASQVSAQPAVRRALLETQRALGRDGGVVLEGRDIGTVVFPDAEVKVFLEAGDEVRARRRWDELHQRGQPEPFERTLAEVRQRDERDRGRAVAPLRAAPDAVRIDTGPLTIDQVVARVVALVEQHREQCRQQRRGRGG